MIDENGPHYFVAFQTPGPNWVQGVKYNEQPEFMVHVNYMIQLQEKGLTVLSGPFMKKAGGLNGELFVELLTQMMRYRKKPVPLIVRQPTKPPWSMYSLPELGVSSPCTSYLAMHRTSTQTSNVRGSSVLLHRSVCSLYSKLLTC